MSPHLDWLRRLRAPQQAGGLEGGSPPLSPVLLHALRLPHTLHIPPVCWACAGHALGAHDGRGVHGNLEERISFGLVHDPLRFANICTSKVGP